ncbi:MAG: hypothetical protein R3174_13205 [Gammaproteobacteria bacterium]|nr:hypothetical protein [Gammaproteobacteria bacterium]
MDPFAALLDDFRQAGVRFLVIGVWGANYYAHGSSLLFSTQDRDLFLPLDAGNLLAAWNTCAAKGFTLWAGSEPLDVPRNAALAESVIARRVTTRASDEHGLDVDLSLVMSGFDFETAWSARRVFRVDEVDIPVARLRHIVESKAACGREKDRLFLATHAEALAALLPDDSES